MNTKFIGVLLGIAISIIMIASVLAPIINDVAADSDTYKNEGYLDYSRISNEGVATIVWDPDYPRQLTVNEDIVSLEGAPNFSFSIITGDNWLIRYWNNESTTVVTLQTFGKVDYILVNTDDKANTMTVTLNNGVATVTDGVTTMTFSYTHAYYPANNGAYTMKKSDSSVYIDDDTVLNIIGTSVINGVGGKLCTIVGSINDGFVADVIYPVNDYTIGDVTVTSINVDSHVNLSILEKLSFVVNDGNADATVTYSYFIVPTEVIAERTNSLDDGVANILYAIPLIMIVAVIAMVAALIRSRD